MAKNIEEMNIYEKLSAISQEITNVNKNLEVGYGSSKYKAVSEGDVLAAVRPIEAKYRVYSYPRSRNVIESGTIETTSKDGAPKKQLFERIETIYKFVNMDNPDDYIEITTYGDGVDTQDKSVGKAMTYGDKYALLKAYKIITGDDPDKDPSEDLNGTDTKKTGRNKPAATPKKGVSPELVEELKKYNVTLEQIAHKKGIDVADLTDEIVTPGLIILRNRNKAPKPNKVEPPTPPATEVSAPVDASPVTNTNDDDFVGD